GVARQRAVGDQLLDVGEAVEVGVDVLDVADRVDDRLRVGVELLLDRGAVRDARARSLPAQVEDAARVEVLLRREAVEVDERLEVVRPRERRGGQGGEPRERGEYAHGDGSSPHREPHGYATSANAGTAVPTAAS